MRSPVRMNSFRILRPIKYIIFITQKLDATSRNELQILIHFYTPRKHSIKKRYFFGKQLDCNITINYKYFFFAHISLICFNYFFSLDFPISSCIDLFLCGLLFLVFCFLHSTFFSFHIITFHLSRISHYL